jgi:hypothetical protein
LIREDVTRTIPEMGRVSTPGAPQRVSAHVVPKAAALATPPPPAPPAEDEEEKTTIESGGWEEEASTTVEQGDVAEKVRALGIGIEPQARPHTSITSTEGHGVADEPTVDDQRASIALAQLPARAARLVITQGNDAGQAIEIRPGKTYTIGRALDNDLVLTDMTVSRKHFDLRGDKGAWVLSDRGSGNGTLINTRLEDAPFTLATDDVIEIGNTVFRFELPSGVPRVPARYGQGDDDLDHSTTSSNPLDEHATPGQLITSVSRPKTLPSPAPLPRPHPPTNRPLYAPERLSPQPLGHPPVPASALAAAAAPTIQPAQGLALHQPPPATTLPLPQMANRPPLTPSALGEPPGVQVATQIGPPLAALPATLPGQGAPIHPPHPARLPFAYPGSTEMPKLQPRGTSRAMAIASAQPPRDATSTAQVPPMSYANGQSAIAPRHYGPPPELSRRTKMVLAGAGLALFAAIATIAIVKGTGNEGPPPSPLARHGPAEPTGAPQITPIDPAPEARPKPAEPTRSAEPAATTPPPAKPANAAPEPPPTPPAPAKPEPTTATDSSDESLVVTPLDPPGEPTPEPTPERAQPAPTRTERRPVRRPERKPEKKIAVQPAARTIARPATKTDAPRAEIDRSARDDRNEPANARAPAERKTGRDPEEVKNGASVLYRARNFSGAAEHVTRALSSFSGADAQELKSLANIYSQLGKSYHLGMAPATKNIEAYEHLRRALDYDRDVGSLYTPEIKKRLVEMSSRAAMQYMANKAFEPAFQAVRMSESLGSTSPSNKLVREKLESVASDLLKAAQGELSTQPDEARRKARQVQGMVDTRHPLHVKATRLLSDL